MQRKKNTRQKSLVLFLERQSKSIDDRSQNFKQLSDPIMSLGFVNEMKEDIVDRSPDESAKIKEFAINSMERRLEKIALPWVFRVEELEEVEYKRLVDISFGHISVKFRMLYEPEEEFINYLKMGPCELEDWFILFRVEGITSRIHRRGYGAEEVGRKLYECK
jgi:hypothetical protein